MATLLESWGVSVFDVQGLSEAEALLSDVGVAPDVLLVDYHLDHDRNGLDAVLTLRRRFGPLPAALVTANRSPDLRKDCLSTGIDHLVKPIEPSALRRFLAGVEPQSTMMRA